MEDTLKLRPIGVIRTPFAEQKGTPVQPAFGEEVEGTVEVDHEFGDALDDLDGFDRIWLLFWLHRARPYRTKVVPYRDVVERGLFSTRAPSRPNPIGLSVVKVVERSGCTLRVSGLDILDGTPLLDIKPYVPDFDACPGSRAGWLDASPQSSSHADQRFAEGESSAEYFLKGEDVVLCLAHGCIETTARRVHRRLTDQCIEGDCCPETAAAVQLLAEFIAQDDFAALRSRDRNLSHASGHRVRLRRSEDGSDAVVLMR